MLTSMPGSLLVQFPILLCSQVQPNQFTASTARAGVLTAVKAPLSTVATAGPALVAIMLPTLHCTLVVHILMHLCKQVQRARFAANGACLEASIVDIVITAHKAQLPTAATAGPTLVPTVSTTPLARIQIHLYRRVQRVRYAARGVSLVDTATTADKA